MREYKFNYFAYYSKYKTKIDEKLRKEINIKLRKMMIIKWELINPENAIIALTENELYIL